MPYPSLTGYAPQSTNVQSYTQAGAAKLCITFSYIGTYYNQNTLSDWLYVYDGAGNLITEYSCFYDLGAYLVVPGDTAVFKLVSNVAAPLNPATVGDPAWGYQISSITTTGPSLTIDTASPLPGATVGQPYSIAIQVSGESGPYNWAAMPTLPPGLNISGSGTISGTPTQAGTYTFTIQVEDVQTLIFTTKSFSLTISAASALAITTSSLPTGQVGAPYFAAMAAGGGMAPYSWYASNLPSGLQMLTTGNISGTPLQNGSFTVAVTVIDAAGAQASANLSLTIALATVPVISTGSLPDGYTGSPYTATVKATGGTTPYSWSLSAGSLPAGLSLNAGTGAITGTPTTAGVSSFTVEVTDAGANTATKALSITVGSAGAGGLYITTASLPGAFLGQLYKTIVAATGGTAPYAFSATGLPSGLAISSAGLITGTPNGAVGAFPISVTVTDSASPAGTYTKTFNLTIGQIVGGGAEWLTMFDTGGAASGGGQPRFIAEVPQGVVDGSNKDFVLSFAPSPQKWLDLNHSGAQQIVDIHFTISGRQITFASAPRLGSALYALYVVGQGTSGASTGNARQFNAGTDSIDWGTSSAYCITGDLSIGMWVKLPSTASGYLMFYGNGVTNAPPSTNETYRVDITGSSGAWNIRVGWEYGNPATQVSMTFTTAIPNDAWRYIGITRDSVGKTVMLYLGDGTGITLIGTQGYATGPDGTGTDSGLGVGAAYPVTVGNSVATIEEHYIWSRTLTQTEHVAAMQRNPSPANLILECFMGSSPEQDLSGNGHSGTVTGTTLVGGH